ncbi:MAG: MFS transporter [Dehalococcoidia bacterium]|nr:MFS transporter [Dehalococcoidia bacterium]
MREDQSSKKTSGRIFYGWWIVAVCFLVLTFHSGCAFYSFGVFLEVWKDEFPASSVTAVSLPASLYLLMLGLTGPAIGRLTDRYGSKRFMLGGAVIAGAGLMLLSQASEVWHLYVLYFMIGIGMSGAGIVPVSAVVSKWFTRRRGTAMGIAMAGIALGALLITPLTAYLIQSISWQVAFTVLGVLTWVFIIPTVMLVMKSRPEDMGLLPDGAKPIEGEAVPESIPEAIDNVGEEGWTLSMAFRSLPFWLLLATFFIVNAALVGVLQHEVSFLEEMGIPMTTAAFALGLTGGIGGVGKLAFGVLADRLSPKYTAILCISLLLVGQVILIMTQSVAMVWVFVFVFGFALGGNIVLQPLVTGHFFGLASFGAIFGWVMLAGAVGGAVGPVLTGALYDASGSYSLAFFIYLVAYVVAIVALLFARRPKLRNAAT